MFFETDIIGDRLPPGTLCFTYDDGPGQSEGSEEDPGPRTAELGVFLQSQGVPATFFAVGKFATEFGTILSGLRTLGHLVANHTYDHPSLPAFVAAGGDVCDQLERTDAAIQDRLPQRVTCFRAPYGDWKLRGQSCSNVAAVLNESELAKRYVGPIGWDIDAGDVEYWRDGRTAQDCAEAYLEAIEHGGRGTVLMHDSTADIEEIRLRNRALDLARVLVPELRARGYRFVRLDQIPQVVSATRVSSLWTLVACDGSYVSASAAGVEVKFVLGPAVSPDGILGGVNLGANRWAFRSPNGLFLSPQRSGEILANAQVLSKREVFLVEQRSGGKATLKTIDAYYLTRNRDGRVQAFANAVSVSEHELFDAIVM